ncbi:MAG TPA: recombination-associated protein RdgC [Burkholderiaceae bacterium]|nr:recombination-associated protein RdgC [Burkholderiaceae bacterium]
MWFKNLKVFSLSPSWAISADALQAALEKQAFQGGDSQAMQSLGWISPSEDDRLVHELNGQYLLTLRAEKKLLPTTVVNQVARARALEIEEQQGYKPGRRQMKEIKEQVTDELRPRAFSVYRDTRVWIDTTNRWLIVDAASSTKSDEVLGVLAKTLDPFPATPLHVEHSPASMMTRWLVDDEPPAGFSIDQDTELRSTGEGRAAVRYVHQTVELDDVRRHVQAGKQCTRLAMTWADRVSFVLSDALDVKRVTPLDVLTENGNTTTGDPREQFDADMALMTGELSRLLADLVEALGGRKAA